MLIRLYATFKQWTDLGGHIRKGEKSEFVVFWKILEKEETNEDTGEKEVRKIPMLRYYNVFHISQVDGVKPGVTIRRSGTDRSSRQVLLCCMSHFRTLHLLRCVKL